MSRGVEGHQHDRAEQYTEQQIMERAPEPRAKAKLPTRDCAKMTGTRELPCPWPKMVPVPLSGMVTLQWHQFHEQRREPMDGE